jgi:hypothetical protein
MLSTNGFGRTIYANDQQPSSNGSAILSNFVIGTQAGTMTAGVPASGVTQSFTVTATNGFHIITTNTINGVTFSSTNNPASTANNITAGSGRTITLTAYGTPISAGTFTYTIDTTPGLTFSVTVQPPPQ